MRWRSWPPRWVVSSGMSVAGSMNDSSSDHAAPQLVGLRRKRNSALQLAPEHFEEPLPMAFRAGPVIDRAAQREHEAVLGAGVPLDAVGHLRFLQRCLEHIDVALGRPLVRLGAGEVAFALDLRRVEMR